MAKIKPFEKYTDRYEQWFDKYDPVYNAELRCVRSVGMSSKKSLEIGVGSGRFAAPLGIKIGVEPSLRMAYLAKNRGVLTISGTGENLPVKNSSIASVLMVTTICFLDNVLQAFQEVFRILRSRGSFIVAFVDKNSPIGKTYQTHKMENLFYREAIFFSTEEVIGYLARTNFRNLQFRQTLFHPLQEVEKNEPVIEGYGKGSFVVIKAQK